MTAAQYIRALYASGASRDLRKAELDRYAAVILKIDERSARRYRRGEIAVPGPVEVALTALTMSNFRESHLSD